MASKDSAITLAVNTRHPSLRESGYLYQVKDDYQGNPAHSSSEPFNVITNNAR